MYLFIRNIVIVLFLALSVAVCAQENEENEQKEKKAGRHFSIGLYAGNRFNNLDDLSTHISRTFSKHARENTLPVERDKHYLASLNFKPFRRWEFQGLMLLDGQKSQLEHMTVAPRLYVFSVSPVYRLKLFRFISLNAGAGISYYLNQLKLKSSDGSLGPEGKLKFNKGNLGVQWLVGAEVFITKRLSFDANVTYRYTRLPRWEKDKGVILESGGGSLEASNLNLHIKGANLNFGLRYYLF